MMSHRRQAEVLMLAVAHDLSRSHSAGTMVIRASRYDADQVQIQATMAEQRRVYGPPVKGKGGKVKRW